MLEYQCFHTATGTLVEIAAMHMIRKFRPKADTTN